MQETEILPKDASFNSFSVEKGLVNTVLMIKARRKVTSGGLYRVFARCGA
jgi:hypothetical protein